MKRLTRVLLVLAALAGAGATDADTAAAAQATPCESYCAGTWGSCSAYFMMKGDFGNLENCDAWLEGCLVGCQF